MKIATTLNEQHPQINIPMAIPKHVTKKQNQEHILQKRVTKRPDTEYVVVVATLTHKPISLTLTLKNSTRLQQSERFKNKKQISYSEEVGDH